MTVVETLLEMISEVGNLMPLPFETKSAHIKRIRGYGKHSYGTIRTTLRRMEERDLIEKKSLGGNRWKYVITPTGKLWRARKLSLKKRNDGLLTMIIFDIPQAKKNAGETFRRFIVKNGFEYFQKSVFVGPYEFHQECGTIAKELDIDKYITVCSAKIDKKDLS